MSLEENCIFCKMVRGEIPCCKVYENDLVLAFLDLAPFNYGHTLVIPKQHSHSITTLGDDYLAAMMQAAARIAPAILRATKAGGFNLLLNNGSVAGQEVPHAHLHVIPRFVDDAGLLHVAKKSYGEGEMAAMAAQIAAKLNASEE